MVAKEYIEKYEKVINYYGIDKSVIYDITKAISFSESFGTHPIILKDLAASGVHYFASITPDNTDAKPLPDTRLMRVLCDTITIALFIKDSSIFDEPDMKSIVGLLSNNTRGVLSTATNRHEHGAGMSDYYKTVEECEGVLDKLVESCSFNSDDHEDLFNYVSDSLKQIRVLIQIAGTDDDSLNKYFKSIYLPEKYDAHGYEVTLYVPRSMTADDLESWELSQLMNILLKLLSGKKKDTFFRDIFISKLVRIYNVMQDLLPIGVGTGAKEPVFTPTDFLINQSVRGVYTSIFNPSVALTRQSVDNFLTVYQRLYSMRG